MPRPVTLVERAMEAQVSIRSLRASLLPLFESALASGNFDLIAQAKVLYRSLKAASSHARRLTGMAEGIANRTVTRALGR